MIWVLASIFLLIALASAWVLHRTQKARSRAQDEARKRYQLSDTGERIAFLDGDPNRPRGPRLKDLLRDEGREATAQRIVSDPSASTLVGADARLVQGVDGDMLLTSPPFALRLSVLGARLGRYVNRLSRRLPPWVVVCPRVRLDSIVVATNPLGRDALDWRRWRKRARMRSVDILICDRRDWRPIVAIVLRREHTSLLERLKLPSGGPGGSGGDRLTDEILNHVGLPIVYATGTLSNDWRKIAPYIDEAILRTRDPCVEGDPWDGSHGTSPSVTAASATPDSVAPASRSRHVAAGSGDDRDRIFAKRTDSGVASAGAPAPGLDALLSMAADETDVDPAAHRRATPPQA